MEAKFETVLSGVTYGCDASGRGVFRWSDRDGWRQKEGTLDAPLFRTKEQFRRYVRERYRDPDMPVHGGKRPGAGRKPSVAGGRTSQVLVRLSAAERAFLDRLCEHYGMTPSEAVRAAIELAARREDL